MSKIKILHLLQSNTFSGAENVVFQIYEMFRNQENIEMIYCSKDGEIRHKLEKQQIPFIPMQEFDYKSIKNAIQEYNPDIIHAHDAAASVMACVCSRNKKIISHIHGNHENMRHWTLKSILMRVTSFKYSRIYWVSNSAYDNYIFRKSVKNKSEILVNVIDRNDVLKKVRADKKTYNYDVVVLGRLNKIKNPIRALKIIKECVNKNNKIKAAFVGNGDLLDECKIFALNNKLTDNIDFLGYVSNPFGILSQSKILLMTSIYEGTPMCALEAMALDKPIVSTPTDGLVDVIINGKTGFYSDEDNILNEKILELLEDDFMWKEFSLNTHIQFEKLMDLNKYKKILYDEYMIGR